MVKDLMELEQLFHETEGLIDNSIEYSTLSKELCWCLVEFTSIDRIFHYNRLGFTEFTKELSGLFRHSDRIFHELS